MAECEPLCHQSCEAARLLRCSRESGAQLVLNILGGGPAPEERSDRILSESPGAREVCEQSARATKWERDVLVPASLCRV